MLVKFTFKGQPVEVEVKCEFRGSKYVVCGTVKRVDVKEAKGVFFIWDCTPDANGNKRYKKPLLRQGKMPIHKSIIEEETDFVTQALNTYKIQRSKSKTTELYGTIPIAHKETVPDGFEPVGDQMFTADAS